MYQFSYAEVLDDSFKDARERERQALDGSIELLEAAQKAGTSSAEAGEALLFVQRLWSILIEDLGAPDNALPKPLRADLISIGLWIMRECGQIRLGKDTDFKALIEVSAAIRDGLK